MTQICFISTSTIQPTVSPNKKTRRIELTPWDLQMLLVDFSQKDLLFHKPTPSQENELKEGSVIDRLKTSLSSTLEIFYPLAGTLVKVENDEDKTSPFFLDCNNNGAQFVHAMADNISVADIIEPTYVPDIVYSFFLMNGVLNYQGIFMPLLAVQVTELVDGIFIACTMNHCVVDGTSLWHFFKTWFEITRVIILISYHNLVQFSNVVFLLVLSIFPFTFLFITMKSLMRGSFLHRSNNKFFIFQMRKSHNSKQKPMLK